MKWACINCKEGLVVGARSMPGNPYDGHILAQALEQAAILSDVTPEVAIDGAQIYHLGLSQGITRTLRTIIKRRSTIEPTIGHMKADGKLGRNWLKYALGCSRRCYPCGTVWCWT